MVEVWLVELELGAAALEAEERRRPRLSQDDLERIAGLNQPQLRRQRRLSTIALRVLIAAFIGSDRFARTPFARLPGGKPVLPGEPVSFSVSHVAGRALIGLSSGAPVGVDLERDRTLRMSAQRRAALIQAANALPLATQASPPQTLPIGVEGFGTGNDPVLRAWVRMEALAKLDGVGVGRLLSAAGILGRRTGAVGEGAADRPTTAPPEWPGTFAAPDVTILDLAMPADATGSHWYAALAAHAALMQPHRPKVQRLPVEPEDLARLTP